MPAEAVGRRECQSRHGMSRIPPRTPKTPKRTPRHGTVILLFLSGAVVRSDNRDKRTAPWLSLFCLSTIIGCGSKRFDGTDVTGCMLCLVLV